MKSFLSKGIVFSTLTLFFISGTTFAIWKGPISYDSNVPEPIGETTIDAQKQNQVKVGFLKILGDAATPYRVIVDQNFCFNGNEKCISSWLDQTRGEVKWVEGEWSTCSANVSECEEGYYTDGPFGTKIWNEPYVGPIEGTQIRTISCEREDGMIYGGESCGATPPQTQSCSVMCYGYAWRGGEWSQCFFGSQEREVYCRRSDGERVDDSFCTTDEGPNSNPPHTTQPCTVEGAEDQ